MFKLDTEKAVILIKQAELLADKIAYPILEPYGLTSSQYKVIKFLYAAPSATVCQIDIEEYFSLRNPTVTGILQNLERNGWIKRKKNPDDGRSKIISVTPKALSIKSEIVGLGDKIESTFTKNLSSDEYKQLIAILKKTLGK